MSAGRTLRICHVYPDALNLYGDRGNVLCLVRRLEWRGIGCEVVGVGRGEALRAADFDLFFIGGGQDFEQQALMEDLRGAKAAELASAAADGKTFLGICGGYQMMGEYYETADGKRLECLELCDFRTLASGGTARMVGNLVFELPDGTQAVGFENHGGRTFLGEGMQPLGEVRVGFGNNGEDGTEGIRDRNIFGTYAHGPVLPKNPALADMVLGAAFECKYGVCLPGQLDDAAEQRAHDAAIREALAPVRHDKWM